MKVLRFCCVYVQVSVEKNYNKGVYYSMVHV